MTAPLRFATFLAPNMAPVYRFLADRIGQRLHRRVELVVGSSFDQFEQGEADLGVNTSGNGGGRMMRSLRRWTPLDR